ncbi:mitochondrial import inner membrane translocase subunit Tim8 B [Narcine bancroftii]|uniref:mitochondrial import inner membrane translocase subunit Tim8 B n=1 Tax=Narcine bancroftii TaxID=1343680 RepID=UPI00383209CC
MTGWCEMQARYYLKCNEQLSAPCPRDGGAALLGRSLQAMEGFGSAADGRSERNELSRMIALEQQKAQFQLKVHSFTDVCWDKCVDKPASRLDSRTEGCLVSCVERFVDITLAVSARFAHMVQKGAH